MSSQDNIRKVRVSRQAKSSRNHYSPRARASANNYGVPANLFWANTLIVSVAFAMSMVSAVIAMKEIAERKQIEVQLMYTNALMIREGMVRPGDMVFGPEGNLEFDGTKFKPKKEK